MTEVAVVGDERYFRSYWSTWEDLDHRRLRGRRKGRRRIPSSSHWTRRRRLERHPSQNRRPAGSPPYSSTSTPSTQAAAVGVRPHHRDRGRVRHLEPPLSRATTSGDCGRSSAGTGNIVPTAQAAVRRRLPEDAVRGRSSDARSRRFIIIPGRRTSSRRWRTRRLELDGLRVRERRQRPPDHAAAGGKPARIKGKPRASAWDESVRLPRFN